MQTNTLLFTLLLFRIVWIFTVMGVTTYVVFWRDASGWWFLLAVLLVSGTASIKETTS